MGGGDVLRTVGYWVTTGALGNYFLFAGPGKHLESLESSAVV